MMNLIIIGTAFFDRLKTVLVDSALGMVVVFFSLIILWGSIELFHLGVKLFSKKKNSDSEEKPSTVDSPDVNDPATVQDDKAVVAAIAAALSAYLEVSPDTFRVVSFKRVDSNAHWNKK